jgi:hypothetical protein
MRIMKKITLIDLVNLDWTKEFLQAFWKEVTVRLEAQDHYQNTKKLLLLTKKEVQEIQIQDQVTKMLRAGKIRRRCYISIID